MKMPASAGNGGDTTGTSGYPDQSGRRPGPVFRDRVRNQVLKNGLTLFFVVLIIVMIIMEPRFLQVGNLLSILKAASIIGIIACGMTAVMIGGGFDLSVARVAAFCGVLVVILQDMGPFPAIALTLLAAAAIGAVNGTLIVKAKVNPFVVTLGMFAIAGSAALLLTGGNVLYDLSPWMKWIGQGTFGPIPKIAVWFIIVLALTHVLLSRTRIGRYIYATGGSYEASRLAGIHVDRVVAGTFVLVALLSGWAGIVLTSRLDSASPIALPGGELDAIAATIIGGTKLSGGEGSVIPGTLIGVLILSFIGNALILLGVDPYWQGVAKGAIIIVAVAFATFQKRFALS